MIEIKDKVVTVGSLSTLHEHNKSTYMTMDNPAGSGTMIIDGEATFSGNVNVGSMLIGSNIGLVPTEDSLEIVFLDNDENVNDNKIDLTDYSKVPINDIYECFKTYWNAGDLVYASVIEDSYDESGNVKVSKAGRRNGMWFGSSTQAQSYIFKDKDGKLTKIGKPINCSTLASLVMLGIPYKDSKYNNELESYYIPNISGVKNSFSLYGENVPINKDNYAIYFLTPRMLNRLSEMGLEIPALHYEWRPKPTADSSSNWFDHITVTSDLREAQAGDIIFWNNDGEIKTDPRDVSHCCLVLSRLSYDSTNPNQPLLLLAEATSNAGVQTSYYMYDTTSGNSSGVNEHKIPKYICRPKYNRMVQQRYFDINALPDDGTEYSVITDSNMVKIQVGSTDNVIEDKNIYTLVFDWTPTNENSYLRICNPTNPTNALEYYLPDVVAESTYSGIKLQVPVNANIATSKDKFISMDTVIGIQEYYTSGSNAVLSNTITCDNFKVYKGII